MKKLMRNLKNNITYSFTPIDKEHNRTSGILTITKIYRDFNFIESFEGEELTSDGIVEWNTTYNAVKGVFSFKEMSREDYPEYYL